jgi:hypothetical protein
MLSHLWLLAQEQATSGFMRLDPLSRAKVLSALAALIILGFAMVIFTWWGARATRRYMRGGDRTRWSPPLSAPDDWAQKPLHRSDDTASMVEDE